MRILTTEIAYFLLIVTVNGVRRKHVHHPIDDHLSYALVKKMVEQLEDQAELPFDDDSLYSITTTSSAPQVTTLPEYIDSDITLRLYPSGIEYALEQIMLAIRHDAMRHRPHTIRTSYHGMDININSIQIVDFLVPKLEVERLSETKFRFFTHGGGMRYLGLYSTVYKTKREGQFEAILDDIRVQLDVDFSDEDEHITVIEKKCIARIEEVLVQLIPPMPTQIVNLLREKIEHRFYEKVCTASIPYITKLANMIRSLAFIEDISARESGSLPPCTIEHDRVAARLDSRGVKLSFKRTIPRQKRATSPNSIVEADTSISEMASVSVTEEYINEILYDLTESGSVLFHLHEIPKIQEILRTRCGNEHCLGSYADLKGAMDGSGHLDSTVVSPIRVEIFANHARLQLSLNTVLSYENRAAHHRIPYLRFGTVITMRLMELNISASDGAYYRWTARYEITALKVHSVHTDFEELKGVAGRLEEHINLHRVEIEELLTTHLNGELPLRLNPLVRLQPDFAIFGHHRVIIPLNFKLGKELLPTFHVLHATSVH
uniref:Secreted protein n=1 Tax=Haemonchus contortus TaxID=6289 RepID=A0A6F7P9K7_HAECO